jgi:hypothetical protein
MAIVATNSVGFMHTFGVGIVAGGLVLLVLPFFSASDRK